MMVVKSVDSWTTQGNTHTPEKLGKTQNYQLHDSRVVSDVSQCCFQILSLRDVHIRARSRRVIHQARHITSHHITYCWYTQLGSFNFLTIARENFTAGGRH